MTADAEIPQARENGWREQEAPGDFRIVWMFVAAIVVKVLWGYWNRDLTFGDTAAYFVRAVTWHRFAQVDIVWSPLYTAYYGSWLWLTENAQWATLLHRVFLICVSTGLVAWVGMRTLPKLLALGLTFWWIALPIHYDTLYEVHLFGAIPALLMLAMAVSLRSERWRYPLVLGVAVLTTALVRNEYSILVAILLMAALRDVWRARKERGGRSAAGVTGRYLLCLVVAAVCVLFFYALSYSKGEYLKQEASTKHTLNMCQVYAFGYQQRHAEWTKNPWSECAGLMQETFRAAEPTLGQMIVANPTAVARHFLWNLQLSRAGVEVLLTNATWSENNPDYTPVLRQPLWPTLILAITLVVLVWGGLKIRAQESAYARTTRAHVARAMPVLVGLLLCAVAVTLTQRPRPSYLLAQGAVYMWLAALCLPMLVPALTRWNSRRVLCAVGIGLLVLAPPYALLPLGSKGGLLGAYYQSLLPQANVLCSKDAKWLATTYADELSEYLCSPYRTTAISEPKMALASQSLDAAAWTSPARFVEEAAARGFQFVTIDAFFVDRFDKGATCEDFRHAFAVAGWRIADTSPAEEHACIFLYAKS